MFASCVWELLCNIVWFVFEWVLLCLCVVYCVGCVIYCVKWYGLVLMCVFSVCLCVNGFVLMSLGAV